MRIPPDLLGSLLGIFLTAQARGWIDVRALEPVLRAAVDRGHGANIRQLLGEVLQLLERVEAETVRPVR